MDRVDQRKTLEAKARKHYQKKLQSKALKITSCSFLGLSLCILSAVIMGWLNLWTILGSLLLAAGFSFFMILRIFPDKTTSEARFRLMLHAFDDPMVIEGASPSKVELNDKGKTITLEPIFRDVWVSVLAPQLFKAHKDTLKQIRHTTIKAQNNERSKKENLEQQIKELNSKRLELRSNLEKLKEREEQLQNAESLVIKQMAEVEDMKKQLKADQEILESQKTELNQLKGELLSNAAQSADTSEEDAALKERIAELEASQAALEERSAYIQTVEDQLIEQLHALTEREAAIEQKEINAGIRPD